MSIASDKPPDAADKRALLAKLMREKRAAEAAAQHPGFAERLAARCAATPDGSAIEDAAQTLTFAELDRRAASLAAALAAMGVSAGDTVAIATRRSVDIAVAVFAVASLGAPWTPVEATDAPARLHRQHRATRPAAVIVSQGEAATAPFHECPVIGVDGEPAARTTAPSAKPYEPFAILWPERTPVPVPSDRVAAQLAAAASILPLSPAERVLFHSSLHSEAIMLELLWPLVAGATVVVVPADLDPCGTISAVRDHAITAARLPPSAAACLAAGARPPALTQVVIAGEPVADATARVLAGLSVTVKTAFGRTEDAGPALVYTVASTEVSQGLPLGHATAFDVAVVDRTGAAVPAGVSGALMVAGKVTDIRVRRRRADGAIELIAMAARHPFVDGRPIDLGALEETARGCEGVADAAAVARPTPTAGNALILYVVPSGPLPPANLRRTLANQLAPWSRPLAIAAVSAIPLDADGAVDRAALAQLPIADDAVIARWEAVLSAGGAEAAVVPVAETAPLGKTALPLFTPNPRPAPEGQADGMGEPLADARPAYADGGPLTIPEGAPETLIDALVEAARVAPDRGLTLVSATRDDQRLTYTMLFKEAQAVAGGLAAHGLKPGAPVILQVSKHREYFSAFWGAVFAGLTPVTIAVSVDYARPTGTVLKLVNAWALLERPTIIASREVAERLGALSVHTDGAQPDIAMIEPLLAAPPIRAIHRPNPEDVLFLQLSSGSTGVPKVIQVTHRGVVAHTHGDVAVSGDHAGDISLNWLPMDHVVPLLTCHLKDTYLGCEQIELVTEDVLADPLSWLAAMARFGATRSWAPNFGFKLVTTALAANPGATFDLSAVRHLMNAGEQVTRPVVEAFLAAVAPFGVAPSAMQPGFGMAETCTCITYENGFIGDRSAIIAAKSSLRERLRAPTDGEDHATFMRLGPPVPGIEIRIADAVGHTLEEGVIGRLQIRGPVVTPGYVANPEANDESFVGDGWFNSGDLGVIVDGHLALTGREKETIIVNGANFYCYEIEDVINTVEGVVPTFAAATAAPSEQSGSEGLAVFFVAADGHAASDVTMAVRTHIVARLGIDPAHVICLAREEFPKTTSGKIQRTALKARIAASEIKQSIPSWFYREVWVPRAPSPCEPPDGAVIVGATHDPVADALHAQIAGSRRTDIDGFADALGEEPAPILVVAFAERAGADVPAIASALADLAAFARVLDGAKARVKGRRVVIVLREGTGADGRSADPVAAALRVAVRSLAQETPDIDIQLIDLCADCRTRETASLLAGTLSHIVDDREVALRPGVRLVSRLAPAALPGRAVSPVVRGGHYLVTGGHGGLGRALCRHLVTAFHANVVAIGRRSLAIADPPAGVRAHQVDVSERAALAACIARIEADSGPLDGVFHLAGVAEARPFVDENAQTLTSTLAAKVGGAAHLFDLFAHRPKLPIVCFGSVNGVFGGANAGAYAAANAALAALAERRREAGGSACTIHWSQWEDGRLAAAFGMSGFATARGFMPIGTQDGFDALTAAMAQGTNALIVGLDGTNPNIRRSLVGEVAPAQTLSGFVAGPVDDTAISASIQDAFGTRVPCRLIAVEALPKHEDGTVDRAVLAHTQGRLVGEDRAEPRGETEARIAAIWCRLLARASVRRDESFFAVGGHSLVAARLMLEIREAFGRELPLRALFGAPTVAGMAAAIDGTADGAALADCLVPLQPAGEARPILCVHPAGGSPLCYLPLAQHLGPGQPCYGFQAVGLGDGRAPLQSAEEIAATYLEAARTVRPGEPLRLAAWSSGGAVAFEMARQAEAAGQEVELLALIDCGLMVSENPIRGKGPWRAAKGLWMLGRFVMQIRRPRSWNELRALAQMVGLSLPERFADVRLGRAFFTDVARSIRLFNANTAAAINYEPQPYGGPVVLVRASGSRPGTGEDPIVHDLERFAAGVHVVELAGTHMSIVLDRDGAAGLAQALAPFLIPNSHATSTTQSHTVSATVQTQKGQAV